MRQCHQFCCLFAVLLLVGSGCEPPQEQEAIANPFDGQSIEVAVPGGFGFAEAWQIPLDEWSAQTGASYNITEYDAATSTVGLKELTAAVAGEGSSPKADVWVLPITHIAGLAHRGLLASVPDDHISGVDSNWLDYFEGLRTQIASVGGRPTVLPLSCRVLVCYYRRDLLEQAGMAPPQTWADYQRLLDTLDQWAPDLTAVEPWNADWRATTFLARAVSFAKHPGNYSLYFDVSTGEPLIDTPGFVRAWETSQRALNKMPSAVWDFDPANCRREILAGRAALALALETGPDNPPLPCGPAPTARAARSADGDEAAHDSRVGSIEIGFCRLPGATQVFNGSTQSWETLPEDGVNQPTLTAFSGLCAGVSSAATEIEQQAGWNFLRQITNDDSALVFSGATRSLSQESDVSAGNPANWVGKELIGTEARLYVNVVAACLQDSQLVAELPVVGCNEFRTTLGEQLSPTVLSEDTDATQVLSAAARKWQEIIDRIGMEQVRDSYRLGLGLRAMR